MEVICWNDKYKWEVWGERRLSLVEYLGFLVDHAKYSPSIYVIKTKQNGVKLYQA